MRVPIFSKMGEAELSYILQQCVTHTCKRDRVIFVEEEVGQSLFIIVRGSVKISRTSDDGREVILTILKAGDFFGELSLLDGKSRSASVTALEESELLTLRRSEFIMLIEKYPQIAVELLRVLAARIRHCDIQIEALTLQDAMGRVVSALIHVAEQTGIKRGEAMIIPKLPIQNDLASMAGTARETISRVMTALEERGYLQKEGHRVTIANYQKFKKDFSKSIKK
jgi:CRP/FNR family cyclic AMP-dependent transcriptional regulator